MTHAIILAGGRGTRFWPLSTQESPKQFLNICSDKPLIEQTLNRLKGLVNKNNIYAAANEAHRKSLLGRLKHLELSQGNLLFEPESKNNFAPIILLAKKIYSEDKEAVIIALPSDHYIGDNAVFRACLKKAARLAKKGLIITLGIKPSFPETGYGYVRVKGKGSGYYPVKGFIEKPGLRRAGKLCKDKSSYWNSGIFVFMAGTILDEARRFKPHDYGLIMKMNPGNMKKLWPRLASVSIDYAIMEKSRKIALIPAGFSWSDLGSWEAAARFYKKDRMGNAFLGSCVDLGSKNTFCYSDKRALATIGLDNLIVVSIGNATLVCRRDKAQDVRKISALLKKKGIV